MAESRLSPDPHWLAELEAVFPGDPQNTDAALGIAYLRHIWPGGEREAREHLDRVFSDAVYDVLQTKLERACADPSRAPAEIREIARELDEIRTLRREV